MNKESFHADSTFGLCALLNARSACRQGFPPALAPRKRCRNSRDYVYRSSVHGYVLQHRTSWTQQAATLCTYVYTFILLQPNKQGCHRLMGTPRSMAPDHINCLAKPRNQGGTHERVHVGRGGVDCKCCRV